MLISPAIEPEQRTAAKVAGLMYLFTMVTAAFAEFYARGRLIVPGDAVRTAGNIAASERLFRLGTAANLVTFASVVVLVWGLYIVLRPVDRNLALLALLWRLAECPIFAFVMVSDLVTAGLVRRPDPLLAYAFVRAHDAGYLVGLVFFGLGSTLFSVLWWRSRYLPRALAALGIFASALVAIVTLAIMVFPRVGAVAIPAYFLPIFLFEVTLGLWLVFKGLRPAA